MEQLSSSPGKINPLLTIWPESERLQIALNSSENSKNHQYTVPKIKYEFSTQFNGGANVSLDRVGLLTLINNGFLRDALFMTTKLLNSLGQGTAIALRPLQINSTILELWSCRFQLMFILKYHAQLLEELIPFGELDAPDLFCNANSSQDKGSIVPFSFRLIHAEAISFSNAPHQSIQRIFCLKSDVHKVIDTINQSNPNAPELAVWHERLFAVKIMSARVLFRIKEYQKSFSAYEQILNELSKNEMKKEKQKTILGTLLRMAMHIGDKKRIKNYMRELANLCGDESANFIVHSCFKYIFEGNYSKALEIMQQFKVEKPEIFKNQEFCNNEAICLLYNGRALECLQMLYNHIGRIEEPVALNLATVSDLVCTNSQVLKQNYLSKHSQDVNDLFDPLSMRIP